MSHEPKIYLTISSLMMVAACASWPGGSAEDGPAPPPYSAAEVDVSADDGTPSAWLRPREVIERERRREQLDIGPARRRATEIVASAVDSSTDEVAGWQEPLPEQPDFRTLLADDRTIDGSLSVGSVSHGTIESPVALPVEGAHHAIIERHRKRRTRWGTGEVVDLLERAAADVAEAYPESTLRVGNIGWRHGGDIPWSSSHNSGRDADLAFYCRNAKTGERLPAPDLVAFDDEGRGVDRPHLRFDVPRNWALVESLLTHPTVDLQWLFVSEPLKESMLAHAEAHDADPAVIEQARRVLHQPTDAPPHNDHLHVRITCSQQDRLEGCLDYGPRWEWVDWHRRPLLARTLALAEALESPSADERLEAIAFLERIRSPYAPEVLLTRGVDDPNPEVRRRALEVAAEIPNWSATAIRATRRFIAREARSIEEKETAYGILRRSHTRRARRFALSRLLDRRVDPSERRLAARALYHVMEPGLVPVLIDELARQPADVRSAVAVVLRRITGHSRQVVWEELRGNRVDETVGEWRAWWQSFRDMSRQEWLRRSFSEHGFRAGDLDALAAVDELIPLLRGTPDHVAYNANRLIHRATERWIPLEAWSYRRLYRYWHRWWQKNRSRILASRTDASSGGL